MLSRLKIDSASRVHLSLAIEYVSEYGKHRDVRHFEKFNVWRDMDLLPIDIAEALMGQCSGYREAFRFAAGQLTEVHTDTRLYCMDRGGFNHDPRPGLHIEPGVGRYYPAGWFRDMPGVFSENMMPARLVCMDDAFMKIDFNHPLAQRDLSLDVAVHQVTARFDAQGGRCHDCIVDALDGPGMQLRCRQQPTDFFQRDAFARGDERPDGLFYARPRRVDHLDHTALQQLQALHGELIPDHTRVLDLMSSVNGHLPAQLETAHVTGLGLNAQELEANPRLDQRIVHDLNDDPVIPADDGCFDVVMCSLSVEYLNRPMAIFDEVARVLRPGGLFIVSFSNRWFPTKAIGLWSELHEFERMGLVSEYFLRSKRFGDLHTRSIRGLPRPQDDRHPLPFSDPVYAVWGYKSDHVGG